MSSQPGSENIPGCKTAEKNTTMPENLTAYVAGKLTEIGIPCTMREDATGFLEDVQIVSGGLHYKPNATASNLLHEAGHLACIPNSFRTFANDELEDVTEKMHKAVQTQFKLDGDPDSPLMRAFLQCSDPEATAWAWAFGIHCGLPHEEIIRDGDYNGDGEYLRLGLANNAYIGINGIRASGFIKTVRDFPNMLKWLQDAE